MMGMIAGMMSPEMLLQGLMSMGIDMPPLILESLNLLIAGKVKSAQQKDGSDGLEAFRLVLGDDREEVVMLVTRRKSCGKALDLPPPA